MKRTPAFIISLLSLAACSERNSGVAAGGAASVNGSGGSPDVPAHDWGGAGSPPALGASGSAGSAGNGEAAACRPLSLREDAYAFELRITSDAEFYKVEFPEESMLHCVGQRVSDVKSDPAAMNAACEAHYFYKKDAGAAPAATLVESFDVVIPFVPEAGLDLTIAGSGSGTTSYEIRGFDGELWASFSSEQATYHVAREQLAPGGLASRLPEWPAMGPKRGAYLFPWYGTPDGAAGNWVHWNPEAPTLYTPSKGQYDSADPGVIAQQMSEARSAGLDLFVVSYWESEAPPLAEYLDAAESAGLEISAMLETSTRTEATRRESVLAQLTRLRGEFGAHPAWLKAAGRPIVFVYDRVSDELDEAPVGATGWDDWTWIAQQLSGDPVVLMFPLGSQWAPAGAALFGGAFAFAANSGGGSYYTGAHGDDWSWAWTARQAGALLALPILPSFERLREESDVPNYRNQWHGARAVMPDMIIVNSWNEYHESTIIEPTTTFGTQWLELTAAESELFCTGELGTLLK